MSVHRMIPVRKNLGRAIPFKILQKLEYLLCATLGPRGPRTERRMDHSSVAPVFRRFSAPVRVHQVCIYPFADSNAGCDPFW